MEAGDASSGSCKSQLEPPKFADNLDFQESIDVDRAIADEDLDSGSRESHVRAGAVHRSCGTDLNPTDCNLSSMQKTEEHKVKGIDSETYIFSFSHDSVNSFEGNSIGVSELSTMGDDNLVEQLSGVAEEEIVNDGLVEQLSGVVEEEPMMLGKDASGNSKEFGNHSNFSLQCCLDARASVGQIDHGQVKKGIELEQNQLKGTERVSHARENAPMSEFDVVFPILACYSLSLSWLLNWFPRPTVKLKFVAQCVEFYEGFDDRCKGFVGCGEFSISDVRGQLGIQWEYGPTFVEMQPDQRSGDPRHLLGQFDGVFSLSHVEGNVFGVPMSLKSSFAVGTWEQKEITSRDGHLKIQTEEGNFDFLHGAMSFDNNWDEFATVCTISEHKENVFHPWISIVVLAEAYGWARSSGCGAKSSNVSYVSFSIWRNLCYGKRLGICSQSWFEEDSLDENVEGKSNGKKEDWIHEVISEELEDEASENVMGNSHPLNFTQLIDKTWKAKGKELVKKFEGLCILIRNVLGSKVEKVIVFDSVVDYSCCSVTGKCGWIVKKIVEISSRNPIKEEHRRRVDYMVKLRELWTYCRKFASLMTEETEGSREVSMRVINEHHGIDGKYIHGGETPATSLWTELVVGPLAGKMKVHKLSDIGSLMSIWFPKPKVKMKLGKIRHKKLGSMIPCGQGISRGRDCCNHNLRGMPRQLLRRTAGASHYLTAKREKEEREGTCKPDIKREEGAARPPSMKIVC